MAAQRAIAEKRATALSGAETTMLLERPLPEEPGVWIGRVRRQAPEVDGDTFVAGVPENRGAGDFMRVRFAGYADYDFEVEAVSARGMTDGVLSLRPVGKE